jgi:hypothetical protein
MAGGLRICVGCRAGPGRATYGGRRPWGMLLAKLAVAVEREVAAKHAADTTTMSSHTTVATAAPEVVASRA